jgi:hypothetical protein
LKNQSLVNRIEVLEKDNKGILESRKLNKFIKSLPIKDQNKFSDPLMSVIIFRGSSEDFHTIMKPYRGKLKDKKFLIDNIQSTREARKK